MPTFSVLVACYNYDRFVGEAVGSVLAQTDDDWELILVDDASTDDTWEVITGFDDPRIQVLRHDTNQGPSATFNTALAAASGDWICNLDSDDRYLPTFLERQRAFIQANPEIDVSGTWVHQIDAAGRPSDGEYERWFNQDWDLNDPAVWVWCNPLCHNSTAVRRSLQEQVGGLRPEILIAADWDKWVRMAAVGARFGLLHEVLVESRLHGGNASLQSSVQMLRDWSHITGDSAAPWWRSIGREDLVTRNLVNFLRDDLLAQLTPEDIAEVLGRATGIDPEQLGELAAALGAAVSDTRADREQSSASIAAYAAHVESLLADHRTVSTENEALNAELAATRSELARTREQLHAVQESRAYRLGQAVRRVIP